ncbi:MAG: hypothetical protein VXW22_11980 [Pseudomonadota bacterium]|jgi:hypothetical protein|nr:hypothetical protein [Pseudomonadota bacterium]
MQKVYLHLGAPKTGSTALQCNLFEKIVTHKHGLLYLGKHKEKNDAVFLRLCEAINKWPTQQFNSMCSQLSEQLKMFLSACRGNVLISDESFIVTSYTQAGKISVYEKIVRLSKVFDGVPVALILSLRNQPDACYSLYKELYETYSGIGGVSLPPRVDDSWEEVYSTYDYNAIVRMVESELLVIDFYCYFFEDFKKNPLRESESLLEFLEVDRSVLVDMPVVNNKEVVRGMTVLPDNSLKREVELVVIRNRFLSWVAGLAFIKVGLSFVWSRLGGLLDKIKIKNNVRLPVRDDDFIEISKARFSKCNSELARRDEKIKNRMVCYGYFLDGD